MYLVTVIENLIHLCSVQYLRLHLEPPRGSYPAAGVSGLCLVGVL